MDIHKEWEQLNKQFFSNQNLNHEDIMNAIKSESSSVITKLKKGLVIKSYYCLSFIALFVLIMIIKRDNIEQVITIGIVAIMYIIGYLIIIQTARAMDASVFDNSNILSSLKENKGLIKRALNLEKSIFLYFSPVIIICSLFYGKMEKGETFNSLIQDPEFLKIVIIATAVLVPLAFILGNYLNSKAFTPLIESLDQNINKLEGIEFVKEIVKKE